MIILWIVIALLLLSVSAALIKPLWLGGRASLISRADLNKQLYRQRLKEIGQEHEQGLIDEIEASQLELQRSLLDDIPDAAPRMGNGGSLIWIPGVLLLLALSLGLYYKLGAWQEVSRWQKANSRFHELSDRILLGKNDQVSERDVEDFMLALRSRLRSEPNDYRSWLLLGRFGLDGNNYEMAIGALERAYKLAPQQSMVTVPYAQALMMTGDQERASLLLKSVVTLEPDNIEALSLYAFLALQQQDFQAAISRWQAMLPKLEPSSTRYQMIERSIRYASEQLTLKGESATTSQQ